MNYFYEAIDESGQSVLGKIDAGSLTEAHRMLTMRGYRPQSIAPNPASQGDETGSSIATLNNVVEPNLNEYSSSKPLVVSSQDVSAPYSSMNGELALTNSSPVSMFGTAADSSTVARYRSPVPPPIRVSDRRGVSSQELLLFFQQLAPLTKSGMTIYAALDNLSRRTRNKTISAISHEMADAARNGGRITDVMARYPRVFPEHVVGTIRAGELGGFLEIVLGEVAINFEQKIALYRGSWKWKAIVVQAWLTLALVLPLFSSLFDSMDIAANMRLYLQREMIILPVFGAIYLLVLFLGKYVQEPHLRRWRDSMSLKIPAIGDLQRQAALSAFVRMLRKLYNAGVGPIHSWEAAMNTADNSVIREKLSDAYIHVQRGGSLADAFASTGLFADNVEQIVVTGELSGELVESLDQAANIYQNRVQDAHDKARRQIWSWVVLAALIIGGGAFLWMVRSYFASIFHFVDSNFGE